MHRLKIFIFLLFFTINYSFSQKPKTDILKTSLGDLKIQPIFHSSLFLQWNNLTIYIDPYGGQNAFKNMIDPDLIIITDIHGDPS